MFIKKSMKISILILFILLFMTLGTLSSAQDFGIGLRGGIDLNVLMAGSGASFSDFSVSPDIGLLVFGAMNESVLIGGEFSYSGIISAHFGMIFNFAAPLNLGLHATLGLDILPFLDTAIFGPGLQVLFRFTYLFSLGTASLELGFDAGAKMTFFIAEGVLFYLRIPIRAYIGFRF